MIKILLIFMLLAMPVSEALGGGSSDPVWLALLHYKVDASGSFRSATDNPAFFVTQTGHIDPVGEFNASIAILATGGLSASDYYCRFPARTRWLIENHRLLDEVLQTQCSKLDAWKREVNAKGVTMLFASADMASPSSMFGHTLLRLDSEGSPLVAYAVNYAAEVPTGEGIYFPFKGLVGGYRGRFSVMPSYLKLREYQHLERRDMWEYHLDLSPDQVQRVVEHIWELREVSFPYYFLNENCAAKLLDVLATVHPGLLELRNDMAFVVPQVALKRLQHMGLIDAIYQSTLNGDSVPAELLKNWTPTAGHQSHSIDLLLGELRQTNSYAATLNFRLRAGYHDLTDPLLGYPAGSAIEFLKFDFRVSNSSLQLREASLVRIRALGTLAAETLNPAWQASLLFSRQHVPHSLINDALTLQAHMGLGAAIRFGGLSLYSLIETRAAVGLRSQELGAGPLFGVFFQSMDGVALSASLSRLEYLPGRQLFREQSMVGAYNLNSSASLLFEATRTSGDGFRSATQLMLGLRYFF